MGFTLQGHLFLMLLKTSIDKTSTQLNLYDKAVIIIFFIAKLVTFTRNMSILRIHRHIKTQTKDAILLSKQSLIST